jgi:hypothetical protein
MIYEFIFNVVKTKILDPDGQIHDDYPAADKFNDEFQKKASSLFCLFWSYIILKPLISI